MFASCSRFWRRGRWRSSALRSLPTPGHPISTPASCTRDSRASCTPSTRSYDEVWGRPCLKSPAELPKGVDLAVMVVPARVAVILTEQAAAAGVRSVLLISSGFAEIGEEGKVLQDQLVEIASRHQIPVLGPNIEGYFNYVDKVAAYGTNPPPEPVAGDISVISQSGTVA